MRPFAVRAVAAAVVALLAQGAVAQTSGSGVTPELQFCTVNGRNACSLSAPSIDASAEPLLVIRMTARNAPGVRFTSGTVTIEHVDSGKRATLQLSPTRSALVHVDSMPPSISAPRAPQDWAATLEAVALTSSLPTGEYRVVAAQVQSSVGPLSLASVPGVAASFAVVSSNANLGHGIELLDDSGNRVATLSTRAGGGQLAVTGYPGLENGNYRLRATFGAYSDTKNFSLNRPTREVNISVPLVEGLPAVPIRPLVMNPLISGGLEGNTAFINRSSTSFSLDGTAVAPGQPAMLNLTAGTALANFGLDASSEGQQNIDLFNTAPDGEHLRLRVKVWDPDRAMEVVADSNTSTIKVQPNGVNVRLLRDYATACTGPVFNRADRDARVSGNGFTCAVTFDDLGGLEYDRFTATRLSGALPNVGNNVVRYRSGVMMIPPGQSRPVFYPSKAGGKDLVLTGVEPDAPALAFAPYSKYVYYNNKLALGGNATVVDTVEESATSGALAGSVTASAQYRGLRIRVTPDGEEPREAVTTRNSLTAPVVAKLINSMDAKRVRVEAWYEKAPEYKNTLDVDLLGINTNIIAAVDRDLNSHTLRNTVITGRAGIARGSNIVYNNSLSAWKVRLSINDQTPVVLDLDSEGRFSFDAGRLPAGQHKIKVEPFAQTADASRATDGARAALAYITVNPGEAPAGTMRINTVNGPAPFTAMAGVTFAQSGMDKHANVTWEVSRDGGASWSPLQDDKGRAVTGIGAALPVRESGSYLLRAVASNKWSGETSIINAPDTIVAFERGSITLQAPAAAAIGSLIEVTANVAGLTGAPVIQWTLPAGATDVNISGNRATFRLATAQTATISARARAEQADPTNPLSWVDRTIGVRVVNPVVAGASITGPQFVEVGKRYSYSATISDVVANPSATRNYTLRGGFVLPNGDIIEGNSAEITITPDMRAITYAVWVDGQPDLRKISTYTITPWAYVWPTWGANVRVLQEALPASIRVTLAPSTSLSSLRGEPIDISWSVPASATVVPLQDGLGATITLNEPGVYNNLIASISDSRGNVTNVTLPSITVASANDITGSIEVISPYRGAMVAPGAYTVKYRITQLPPGARFQTNELYFNGEKVGEFTGTYAIVQIQDPGTHTIGVRTLTQNGQGMTETTVNLDPAPAPSCTIARGTSSGGQSITPTCTAAVGVPATYQWSWIEAGQNKTASTRSVYFSRSVWGQIANLRLTVTTNLGAQQTFEVEPPAVSGS